MDNNVNRDKLNIMLQMAANKLGLDPQKLQNQLEQGVFNEALSRLGGDQSAYVNRLISNPKALEQMLNNPQVKKALEDLMDKKS